MIKKVLKKVERLKVPRFGSWWLIKALSVNRGYYVLLRAFPGGSLLPGRREWVSSSRPNWVVLPASFFLIPSFFSLSTLIDSSGIQNHPPCMQFGNRSLWFHKVIGCWSEKQTFLHPLFVRMTISKGYTTKLFTFVLWLTNSNTPFAICWNAMSLWHYLDLNYPFLFRFFPLGIELIEFVGVTC